MFGGSSGLTHREMSGFFLHELEKHRDEVGPAEGSNRSEVFKWWLGHFPVAKQKRLLLQLCREEYPMWHEQPARKDRDELAAVRPKNAILSVPVSDAVQRAAVQRRFPPPTSLYRPKREKAAITVAKPNIVNVHGSGTASPTVTLVKKVRLDVNRIGEVLSSTLRMSSSLLTPRNPPGPDAYWLPAGVRKVNRASDCAVTA